jgi:hypothetical protein
MGAGQLVVHDALETRCRAGSIVAWFTAMQRNQIGVAAGSGDHDVMDAVAHMGCSLGAGSETSAALDDDLNAASTPPDRAGFGAVKRGDVSPARGKSWLVNLHRLVERAINGVVFQEEGKRLGACARIVDGGDSHAGLGPSCKQHAVEDSPDPSVSVDPNQPGHDPLLQSSALISDRGAMLSSFWYPSGDTRIRRVLVDPVVASCIDHRLRLHLSLGEETPQHGHNDVAGIDLEMVT